MNNQNQTNDSLFTEIELDEAVNVNGGNIWRGIYPYNLYTNCISEPKSESIPTQRYSWN